MIDYMTLDSEITEAIESGDFSFAAKFLEEYKDFLGKEEYDGYVELIRAKRDEATPPDAA